MTLDPNAKKAAYDAALPALNRNAAPFHVIDLAIEAYLAASRVAHIPEPPHSPQPHTGRAGVTDEMVEAAARVIDPAGIFNLTWQECKERARAALNAALT